MCDVVLSIVGRERRPSGAILSKRRPGNVIINATSAAYLMEQCQSHKALSRESALTKIAAVRLALIRARLLIMLTNCAIKLEQHTGGGPWVQSGTD
jgi:hypothetical protein